MAPFDLPETTPGSPRASRRAAAPSTGHVRTGTSPAELQQAFLDTLRCHLGRALVAATPNDVYLALALTVRDHVLARGVRTTEAYVAEDARVVAYLSAEYLPGPHLDNYIHSLGIRDAVAEAMASLGFDLDAIVEQEEEPGLGNGGLGRLASCYMDSLAALEVPAVGYGIRYEFGIFDQKIEQGWQVETTDEWLRFGNPWEVLRPEIAYEVKFGGRTEARTSEDGRYEVRWIPDTVVRGVACDTPVLGYRVGTCNQLRLWKAEAVESFDFAAFNHGDYYRAVEDKVASETITKVLYPNDEVPQGKALRLQQQYLFVSCSLQDMLRLHGRLGRPVETFHEKWAVQLNDTHPALAVAELMRLLVDEHGMDWDRAWHVTRHTISYTNHTLLPEALEKWPVPLMSRLLPRHVEIILELNRRFLDELRASNACDEAAVARLSLVDERGDRYIRMANLATLGSHTVNGVSALHSRLLTETVLRDFAALSPQKFCNVTNGVTPRRFLAMDNRPLARLVTGRIGDDWERDLTGLRRLEPFAADAAFREEWRAVKLAAKERLAAVVERRTGVRMSPASLLDVQAKRLHEYKRQHLNVLHILARYRALKRDGTAGAVPRTFLFGAKAAPGYAMAKLIIRLITATADVVNDDPDTRDALSVVFFPDFNVKNARHVYPAADLSEQISTAGQEASGTGNMKFAMNGALTIGTLDGANVEIRDDVGAEHFFLFGMTAEQVRDRKAAGYRPSDVYEGDPELRDVIDFVASGGLAGGDRALFRPIVDNLLGADPFLVLADYRAYVECQARVDELWRDPQAWTRSAILNTARVGRFSSDRAIREYCERIWHVEVPSDVAKEGRP
jgi:starch phosphorylase